MERNTFKEGVVYTKKKTDSDEYQLVVQDFTGNYISDADWHPGKIGMAFFRLTEDEFYTEDIQVINQLLELFLTELPEDRVERAIYSDSAEIAYTPCNITAKCKTADSFRYEKYKTTKVKNLINTCNQIFVMYDESTGKDIPYVDGQGNAWVFTEITYAENAKKKSDKIYPEYKVFTPDEFNEFVKSLYSLGLSTFLLNPGTESAKNVKRNFYLPDTVVNESEYFGAEINNLIIRYRQNSAFSYDTGTELMAANMWNRLCRKLSKSLFLVPFEYTGEPNVDNDMCLHATPAAAKIISKMAAFPPIYGGVGYEFASKEDVERHTGKMMHFKTVIFDDRPFLSAFTDVFTLKKIFGNKERIAVVTFDELIEQSKSAIDGSLLAIMGIVINPGGTNLVLDVVELMEIKNYYKRPVEAKDTEIVISSLCEPVEIDQKTTDSVTEKQDVLPSKERKLSGLCLSSMILSFVAIVSLGVLVIPELLSVIFAILGIRKVRKAGAKGKGFAITGLVVSLVALFIFLCAVYRGLGFMFFLILSAASVVLFSCVGRG